MYRGVTIWRLVRRVLVAHIWVWLACLSVLVPLAWGLSESFHSNSNFFAVPYVWIPRHLVTSNFADAWRSVDFGREVLNSLVVACVVSVGTVTFGHMAAYSFAHFNYRAGPIVFALILSTLLLPFSAIMVPVYEIARSLGLVNSYAGLIVPGLITPQAIFFFRQYVKSIPAELVGAARVDGASEWGIYWRIIWPLSMPAIVAVGALTFITSWTNLLWPLIVVETSKLYTIPLGLAEFNGTNFTNYVQMIALSLLSMVPVIILFLVVRRKLLANLMASGGALR